MTEELKQKPESQEDTEKDIEPISIATRNFRLLKRVILGKKKPPLFLRVLCWINMTWSLLMVVYYGTVGILIVTSFMHDKVFEEIGGKYFFVYTCLHALAFIGAVLMWRLKKIGFYIFTIATGIMPFLYLLMTWEWTETLANKWNKIEPIILLFSLVTIGLFALNWKSLNLIKKKEIEEVE